MGVMTHEPRLVGRDMTVLSVDGNSAIATVKTAELNISIQNADLTALKDSGTHHRAVHYSWTMRLTGFKPADPSPGGIGVGSQWLQEFSGLGILPLRFVEATGGQVFEGSVLLSSWRTSIATEGQDEEIDLQGVGDIKIGTSTDNGETYELSDDDAWIIATYGSEF